ncbi:MAG: hypothetical protein J0H68_02260 [Sphingobacteriia bacterium]|nr:hypothetical protein [Sphingobacteriia bacterium]
MLENNFILKTKANKTLKNIFFISALVLSTTLSHASTFLQIESSEPEVRRIVPPKFEKENIALKVTKKVQLRAENPVLEVEFKRGKYFISNYGFNDGGWTLGPASAKYVTDLFIHKFGTTVSKNEPIAVIGRNAQSLFTALELKERGYNNISVYIESLNDLLNTSDSGIFTTTSTFNEKSKHLFKELGLYSYKYYKEIAQGKHKYFWVGAKIIPGYFQSREDADFANFVKAGLMRPAKNVELDFGNGTTRPAVMYEDTIFIDAPLLTQKLYELLKDKGVVFKELKINDVSALRHKVIVDTSGVSPDDLVNSRNIYAQQYTMVLKNEYAEDLNYVAYINFGNTVDSFGQTVNRAFYIHPKRSIDAANAGSVGVIGGSISVGTYTEQSNPEEFNRIIETAREFYGVR